MSNERRRVYIVTTISKISDSDNIDILDHLRDHLNDGWVLPCKVNIRNGKLIKRKLKNNKKK